MKPTMNELFDYIDEIDRLTQKTWDHTMGAVIGTVITILSAICVGVTLATLGLTLLAFSITTMCVAMASFGIWYAAPWFSYHAMLTKIMSDWIEKYGDE